jgi:hypothetical protein
MENSIPPKAERVNRKDSLLRCKGKQEQKIQKKKVGKHSDDY